MLKKLSRKIKFYIDMHDLIENAKTTGALFVYYVELPILAVVIWVIRGGG